MTKKTNTKIQHLRFKTTFALHHKAQKWEWYRKWHGYKHHGKVHGALASIYSVAILAVMIVNLFGQTVSVASWQMSASWGTNEEFLNGTDRSNVDVADGKVTLARSILDKVKTFDAGYNNSIAVTVDDKVYSTGSNGSYGKLGMGSTADVYSWVETQNGSTASPSQVATGYETSFIINSDNTVAAAGYGGYVTGSAPAGNTWSTNDLVRFTKISTSGYTSASYNYSLAIDADKNLWVTGRNAEGQLGLGDTTARSFWTKTSLTNVVDIAAGFRSSYAVIEDAGAGTRTLYVTGYNNRGQLGLGDTTQRTSWTVTSQTHVSQVEATRFTDSSSAYYIDTSNNLFVAGYNGYGQLGLGNTTQQNSWIQSATNVLDVSAGYYDAVIVKTDKTVWGTGYNNFGQLGLGNTTSQTSWTQTALSGATAVSCGNYHTLVLMEDMSLWGFGYNMTGQLGTGDVMRYWSFADSGLASIKQVSAGYGYAIALSNDNKIYSTGDAGTYGSLGTGSTADVYSWVETQNGSTASPSQVATGYETSFIINSDNTVAAAGYGGYVTGSLPSLSSWYTPPSSFTKIATSSYNGVSFVHSLAIDTDKNLWVTGRNAEGQLGLGDTTARSFWTKTSLTNVVDIAAGAYSSYAVIEDAGAGTRTLYVTGYNNRGQLGLGDTTQRTSWTVTSQTHVSQVGVARYTDNESAYYIDDSDNLFVAGYNGYGQLGLGNTTQQNSWIQSATNVLDVSAGYYDAVIVKTDKTVWGTGYNNFGQLGLGNTTSQTSWTQTALSGATAVSCGNNHTTVLLEGGALRVAGYNGYGQLGLGDNLNDSTFQDPGLASIKQVSAGYNYTIVLSNDNKIYSTGDAGSYGKLGTGGTADLNTFTQTENSFTTAPAFLETGLETSFIINSDNTVAPTGYGGYATGSLPSISSWYTPPKHFTKISTSGYTSASYNYSLAIDADKNLWVTGRNAEGQLGLGDTTARSFWTKTSLTNVVDIAAGFRSSYAVIEDAGAGTRTLYVTGYNNRGQLGLGDTTQRTSWTVTSQTHVSQVEATRFTDSSSAYYIDTSNNLFVAGYNGYGQLGLGNTTQQNSWIQSATNVLDVSAGYYDAVIVKTDKTVWGTGYNNFGQLGLGNTTSQTSWTQTALSGATAVSCGNYHTLVLMEDGTVKATGYNEYGNLGTGDYPNRIVPIETIIEGQIINPFPYASSGYVRGLYLGGETPIVFYGFNWEIIENANSNVKFRFRHADTQGGLATADWSEYFDDPFSSGNRVVDNWFEFELSLYTSERHYTPTIESFTALYYTDALAPNNPLNTDITAWSDSTKTLGYNSSDWHNDDSIYFEWTAPTDNGESGVAGYYVYFGPNQNADPVVDGAYQVGTNYTTNITDNTLSGNNLYLSIRTADAAGNIYTDETGDYRLFTYKYDNELPLSPETVSVSPMGWTTVNDFTFSWDVASDTSAYGGISGVNGYEYKAGDGEWVATDLLGVANIQAYQNGQNIFYVRSVDAAGNKSVPREKNYLFNGAAPSAPTDLAVTPQSSTNNSFSFEWALPLTYNDGISGYRYSINVPPSDLNTTFTTDTTLGPIPAATQQGLNTFYLVAVDVAGNYSYAEANIATVQFECNTVAPGIPLRPTVTDYSDRANEDWKLVVSWQTPSTGGTVAKYIIERAVANPESEDSWSEAGTSTTTTFAEAGLNNEIVYYYRIYAADNAGSVSAPSEIVSKQPTGKYTTPPTIVSGPEVKATAVGATVTWVTDRASSSFVEYSTDTDFDLSNGSLTPVTDHEVVISGLLPGTNYQYRVQSLDEQRDYDPSQAYSLSGIFETSLAPSISNVEITDIGLHSAIISWKTTSSATSKVMYGETINYGSQYVDNSNSSVTTHTVKLTDLDDSTTYNFKIQGIDIDENVLTSDNYAFTTLTYPVISGMSIEQVPNMPTSTIKIKFSSNVPTTSQVVANGKNTRQAAAYEFLEEHEVILTGLSDNTEYVITAKGRDRYGNEARTVSQNYKTAFDTRAPMIFNVTTESEIQGVSVDAKGQLVISWETDEPGTSQVEYGIGSTGNYTNRTQEDTSQTTSHVVVISDLKPSTPYHFRVISNDESRNEGKSEEYSVLTPEANRSVFDAILNALDNAIGWLFRG